MKIFAVTVRNLAIISSTSVWILASGCQPAAPTVMKANTSASSSHEHDDHGHDHSHDHSHDHGPNGGHLVDLTPSKLHAEWAHDDDTGKITLYFSDSIKAGKKIESAKIELNVAGQESKTYDFTVTDKQTFELESVELLTAIELCSGEADSKVSAKLIVSVDGNAESAPIVHHDHGHNH